MVWICFSKETFNPGRLAEVSLTFRQASDANIQVTQFCKTHAIYYCIAKPENAKIVGEFKGFILATTISDMYFYRSHKIDL